MPSISDPIISIKGLGKKTSDRLNQLGIHTLEHLVFHLPSRYQDKTSITSLSDASLNDEILIEATIDRIEVIPSRQRQLLCFLSDNQNHRILLRFFHFNQYQKQALVRGEIMQCFGEIKIGRKGLEMHHPEYRIITQNQSKLLEPTLTPIYPLCSGISQNKMKQWVNYSLEVLKISQLDDYFEKITQQSMPSLKSSLMLLHHPEKTEDLSNSDVILLGVSRTSKTPTSIYLANKGFKTSNIPLVNENSLPKKLRENPQQTCVVGLHTDPERLVDLRKNRMNSLKETQNKKYTNIENIKKEVVEAKKTFQKYKWPSIDVTRKSVEETAASIIKIHDIYLNNVK